MVFCQANGLAYVLVGFVADEVNEEIIFPLPFFTRPRLYIGQVYLARLEKIQDVHQCSCFMSCTEQHRCFVFTGGFCILFAYDQKSGYVTGDIFDVFADNSQAV